MAVFDNTEFTTPTGIEWRGDVGVVQYGTGMVCTFFVDAIHNPAKSKEAGRPVHDDIVYVRIHPPGERYNIVIRPARDSDKQRFPREWQQFNANVEQFGSGTPIGMLYPSHPSIAATLKGHGVHTIEQCAEMSGVAIDSVGMGAQRWQNDAKKYLEMANKGVSASQLRQERDELESQIRVANQQIELLKTEIQRIQSAGTSEQMENLQRMVMSMAGRPQMAAPVDMAQAMINANHPTHEIAEIAQRRRGRPPGTKNKPKSF